MCTYSMIGDYYGDQFKRFWPNGFPPNTTGVPLVFPAPEIPKEEFDKLKQQVEDLKGLLKKAKIYDEQNGEPNCETDEKMKILRAVAAALGVELP